MSSAVKDFARSDDEVYLKKLGYSIGTTIGEGSYAKVKSAYSESLQKRVAMKIINRKKAPKDFKEKFLPRELDILKHVNHPNVIKMYEILEFESKIYIVMEHAGHGDLLEYIKLRGAVPEDKARAMFTQLCQAVIYLHQSMIAHRDLKCENLLLDYHNNIKVSDFGFARYYEDPSPNTLSKTFCGSAAYAAPEILQGISYFPPLHDIWAMGVILYIMVCASMPYDDSNIKKMIKDQLERKVGFSKSKVVSAEAKDLIRHILEVNVNRRYTLPQIIAHPWLQKQSAEETDKPGPSGNAKAAQEGAQKAAKDTDKIGDVAESPAQEDAKKNNQADGKKDEPAVVTS
ncbi:testis-specific serine/threonine-protein kinase 2-like [Babylonia areolata]|uniref:testis-specific serine/threonine-protein kinase 2-like n=1 Tax=Babylonia areolata TaxID=304850 RepID=UPI003FD317BA